MDHVGLGILLYFHHDRQALQLKETCCYLRALNDHSFLQPEYLGPAGAHKANVCYFHLNSLQSWMEKTGEK